MFEDHNASIYDAVSASNLLSAEKLETFVRQSRQSPKSLADVILQSGKLSRKGLLEIIARYLQCEYLDNPPAAPNKSVYCLLKPEIARKYAVVPLRVEGSLVHLAARDPFNGQIVEDLAFFLHKDIRIVVCDPDIVSRWLRQIYGDGEGDSASLEEVLAELESEPESESESLSLDPGKGPDGGNGAISDDSPVIRFVDLVLTQAVKERASDIHFELFEDRFRIRCRVDGALREMPPPPRHLVQPVTARLKVMANLNLAEKRVPQDGRIRITLAGRPVDLRVSTLPTSFGESVVLRILDKSNVSLDLDRLNLPPALVRQLRRIARLPHGLFIVTGPTGCGKTTTLYSVLREINHPDMKILTIEDPVEYEIDGIMQVAVNSQIDLTFSRALRSFLRHDPDKILVGEIRDLETARIAMQASLTGHLVLTTLHTNNVPGAVTRLVDMGLEPYLLAATLDSVLAQRLLRRICNNCRRPLTPPTELMDLLGTTASGENGGYFAGTGCDGCGGEGFLGRIALFEMLVMSESLREMMVKKASAHDLEKMARQEGMKTLREDGLRAISEGLTTVEEVLKYT